LAIIVEPIHLEYNLGQALICPRIVVKFEANPDIAKLYYCPPAFVTQGSPYYGQPSNKLVTRELYSGDSAERFFSIFNSLPLQEKELSGFLDAILSPYSYEGFSNLFERKLFNDIAGLAIEARYHTLDRYSLAVMLAGATRAAPMRAFLAHKPFFSMESNNLVRHWRPWLLGIGCAPTDRGRDRPSLLLANYLKEEYPEVYNA
jgi:hypothetical protein